MNKKAGLKISGGLVNPLLILGIIVLVLSGGKIFSLLRNPVMLILIVIVIFALRKN